jgi:hypothetical protein
LNSRNNDISDATADLLASQQAKAEEFTPEEKSYVTTLDTSKADWEQTLL